MTEPAPEGLHPAAAAAVLDPDRLGALAATGLPGTGPEDEFDRLTSLTARSTGAPISLVTLVGSDRSFFKSVHGLPETDRTVSLARSMCQHVVASGEPLVVGDTRGHPLLGDNGAVIELGARAYLGVPLRSPAGHVLGAVCAVDVEPREWSPDDVATLVATAAAAQGEIALRAERGAHQAADEARVKAERMGRHQASFLANMSHEIRTPLTAILGFAEVLADEVPDDLREFAVSVRSGGERLLGTINAVLDLAQIEAGRMDPSPRPTDVGALLAAAVRDVHPLASAKGVLVAVGVPPGMPALTLDSGLLDRVVSNLVGNAVKFTEGRPTGDGRVEVRVRYDGTRLRVEVSDTGIGISPDDLRHLFEEFWQVSDGHARTHEGNGLGLALVRRVTALMGGEVTAESELGVGSRFTVSVPALAAPANGGTAQLRGALLTRPPTVPAGRVLADTTAVAARALNLSAFGTARSLGLGSDK